MIRFLFVLVITLAIGRAARAQSFSLTSTSLSFSANAGTSPASQKVTLTNNTSSNLQVSLNVSTQSGGNWLSASISPNPVGGKKTGTITVTISSSTLQASNNNYNGTIAVSGGGTSAQIAVSLQISGVSISATSSVSASVQKGQKTQTSVHISGGPATVQVSSSAPYIVPPASAVNAPGDFSVTVDASSLGGGNYSGNLTLQCVNGSPCVPVAVSVSVTVIAPFSIQISPNPPPGVTLVSGQMQVIPFSIIPSANSSGEVTIASGAPWLKPATTDVMVNSSTQVNVTVDATGLAAGPYSSTVTFSCVNGGCPPVAVPVSLTVGAPARIVASPTTLNFQAGSNNALPPSQTVQLAASDQSSLGFVVSASSPGNWLKATANQSFTPVTLTVSVLSIPGPSSSGTVTITPTNGTGLVATIVVSLTAPNTPTIQAGGVITASAFGGASSIGSGTFVEIYGSNLAQTQRQWGTSDFNGVNAPTVLDNVRVTFNSQPAFVNYISPGQVNVVTPDNVGSSSATLVLTNSNGTTSAYTVNVSALQPGLLAPSSFSIGGKQYVAALFGDGTFVLPTGSIAGLNTRPAKPGETIVLYGIGLGPVDPSVPAGTIAVQATSLHLPLQILFGQTAATIAYAGSAVGFVGLYQINVTVPLISDNAAVPFTFNLGGTPGTQTLYIAVHQ